MALRVWWLCLSLFLFQLSSNQDTKTELLVDNTLPSDSELISSSIPSPGDSEIQSSDQTPSVTSPPPTTKEDNVTSTNTTTVRLKTVCTPEKGCTPPLNCLNITSLLSFSNYTNVTEIFEQFKVVKVNSSQLTYLLDSSLFTNSCLLVMYYAVWCPYSIDFMPNYRDLGRVFPSQLTAVALDFGDKDQEKFLLAYIPRVLLYYSGRAVYDLDTTMSLHQLIDTIANLTRLVPLPLDSIPELDENENETGLPVEWVFDSTWYYISIIGIALVITIHLIKRTRAVLWLAKCRDLIRNLVSKIKRD